jgi:hypothetical protein
MYDDNPARHMRLTTTEMGGLRSLNLGESDMRLGIGLSGMEEAGEGTFSRIHVKTGAVIEYLDGIMVTHANDSILGGKYAIQATSKDKSRWKVIDMGPENCCYSRYANDRINQAEDNCKVELRNGRAVLVAIEEIFPGDELTYAYGRDYWVANYKCLSKSARQHVCKYWLIKDECLWREKLPYCLLTKKSTTMKTADRQTDNATTKEKLLANGSPMSQATETHCLCDIPKLH